MLLAAASGHGNNPGKPYSRCICSIKVPHGRQMQLSLPSQYGIMGPWTYCDRDHNTSNNMQIMHSNSGNTGTSDAAASALEQLFCSCCSSLMAAAVAALPLRSAAAVP
jgi:hypothetical protein